MYGGSAADGFNGRKNALKKEDESEHDLCTRGWEEGKEVGRHVGCLVMGCVGECAQMVGYGVELGGRDEKVDRAVFIGS